MQNWDGEIVLIGSKDEKALSQEITNGLDGVSKKPDLRCKEETVVVNPDDKATSGVTFSKPLLESNRVISLVGETSISDLFSIIKNSRLVVGPDSMAIHIASLTQIKSLNVSLRSVRFWETGPYFEGSRVIYEREEDLIASDRVAKEVISLLKSQNPFGVVFKQSQINQKRM